MIKIVLSYKKCADSEKIGTHVEVLKGKDLMPDGYFSNIESLVNRDVIYGPQHVYRILFPSDFFHPVVFLTNNENPSVQWCVLDIEKQVLHDLSEHSNFAKDFIREFIAVNTQEARINDDYLESLISKAKTAGILSEVDGIFNIINTAEIANLNY